MNNLEWDTQDRPENMDLPKAGTARVWSGTTKLSEPWQLLGHCSDNGQVWIAPLGTPWPALETK